MLFLLWIVLALIVNPYENFTSITVPYLSLPNTSPKILLKGNKLEGKFLANENYLGTVLLNFSSVPSVGYDNQDKLLFRIKEKGATHWYYQGVYHSGGFKENELFPFGFPIIHDSYGKTYIFQLISLNGNLSNAVTVGTVFDTRFISSKKYLLHSFHLLLNFIYKKIIYSFIDISFILNSFIYITPLLFYIVLLLSTSRSSTDLFFSNGKAIFTITLIAIFCYSFSTVEPIIGISIFFIGWWVILIYLKKVDSRVSFSFFALLLALGYIGVMFSQTNFSTRISSWAYIFLLIGAIQAIFEEKLKI